MDTEVEFKPQQQHTEHKEEENKDEEESEDVSCSSDSDIGDALDWLDSKDEFDGSFSSSLSCWRPNAHGGHHSHSSTLQPHANRNQKFSHHIRASPLEVPFFKFLKPYLFSLSFMPSLESDCLVLVLS